MQTQSQAESKGSSIYKKIIMLSDSQIFTAIFVSLLTGIFAVRLGTQLYK
jgi:photosystem I reaction center subunit XII